MKKFNFFVILFSIVFTALKAQYVGAIFGTSPNMRDAPVPATTVSGNKVYNMPMFLPNGDQSHYDNYVEEFAYSGLDVACWLTRGYTPNNPRETGDPRLVAQSIAAMDRCGLSNAFKFCLFDDNAASWTAARNLDNGDGYDYTPLFDCGNTANYKYIWDYSYKAFYQNCPNLKRFKINGKPVIIIWHAGDAFFTNQGNGNLKKILMHVRQRCQAEFGFNPFIIVSRDFLTKDPACNDATVIDAIHDWFSMNNSWTAATFNGKKIGVYEPGFRVVQGSTNMYIDANHGQTLLTALNNTVGAGCLFTFNDAFMDWSENTALLRGKKDTYANTFYDYPNQRINIVRRYTSKAYADTLKVQAEGCDNFYDATSGNSGGLFRAGDIDVTTCSDTYQGWKVTNTQANEWMEWLELPLLVNTKFQLRYSSTAAASVKFSIDGTALSTINLPSTNGGWSTIDAGSKTFTGNGLHTVRLTIVSGSPEINYFKRVTTMLTSVNDLLSNELNFTCYPNPFGQSTTLSYSLDEPSNVTLAVYNMLGKKVAVIIDNAAQSAGRHQVLFDRKNLSNGVYSCVLKTNSRIVTNNIVIE